MIASSPRHFSKSADASSKPSMGMVNVPKLADAFTTPAFKNACQSLSLVSGSSLAILPIWPVNQEEAAFSAASFALASALAAVRAARSECHAAVIYCVNRPNGSASTFVSGL